MRKKLKEKKYIINYYSAKKLLENGYLEDDFLVCDKDATYYSLIDSFPHEDCILFDQTIKVLGENANITEIFIIIDFKDVDKVSKFLPFKNGIKLHINGNEIIYQDYLKSNSMNKNSRIYYINSEYYSIIHERISFGFDKVEKVPLSKWYAYSGLSLSDATILNGININRDELCIIPDKIFEKYVNCITAISVPILVDILYKYQDRIEKHLRNPRFIRTTNYLYEEMYTDEEILLKDCFTQGLHLEDLDEEINCYYNSEDFETLPEDIRTLLDEIIALKECNIDDVLDVIDDLIYDYESELNPNEIEWHKIHVKDYKASINCFDGEGLISKEFAEEINSHLIGNKLQRDEDEEERENKTEEINSFQIRLPFLKGVVHSTDIEWFCRKNKVSYIEGIYSFSDGTMKKYDVNNIKMVITESQFKASSFMRALNLNMDDYFDLVEKYDYHIAVSGVEPKEKHEVKLCYQFLSTLPVVPDEIDYLIEQNQLSLYDSIEEDNIVEGLKVASSKTYPTGTEFYDINPLFYVSTSMYLNKRRDFFEFEKNNMALGKLKINGTRKYLSSDLLALLYHMIGRKKARSYNLKLNEFYCPNTALNPRCIILRNPHYSRNEIVIMQNSYDKYKERNEFFGHLTGVFMVNPEAMIADRLGGADYDGDEVCILNDDILLNKVYNRLIKNNTYIYPLVKIPSITNQSRKGGLPYNQRINSLESTFSNRTGKISNFAFEKTLDAYWSNTTKQKELSDVSFFTLLGGLEIDSCKNGKKPALPKRRGETIEYLKVKDIFFKKRKNDNEVQELRQYIQTINNQHDKNTLYYVFSNFMRERLPGVSKGFEFQKFEVYNDEFLKAVAITECYNYVMQIIRDDSSMSKECSTIKSAIEHELSQIFKKNNYIVDVDLLLNKLEKNAIENYNSYFEGDIKFHFLSSHEDKVNYILNYLEITNLSLNEIDALCDFNNMGYKALYLSLYYNYLSDTHARLSVLLNDYSYTKLSYIDKKTCSKISDLDTVFTYIEEFIYDVSKIVEKTIEKDMLIIRINKYFEKVASDINYEAILSVINPLESKMVFTVYRNQIKQYLNELAGDCNE